MNHDATWNALMGGFVTYLQAADRSPGTIRLYRYRIMLLAEHAKRPSACTPDMLLHLLARPGWAPETRKSVRTAWRAFFGWAVRAGKVSVDPTLDLPAISVPQAEPRPAPERVVRASILAASDRERFMVQLGAYAGLRCCEIARVHADDWDGRILQVVGKGRKVRRVPIRQPELVQQLDQLEGWAFPNRWTGQPITAGHVSKLLSRVLGHGWTAHPLRHRFGTIALEATKDLLAVGQVMGHSRPETTQRYCKVGQERLDAVAIAAAA